MIHDGRSSCRCRRCNNLRHNRLVAAFKRAVSIRFGSRAYVDDIVQYHGKTVREGDVIGPWIDAGMSKGTADVFVCLEGRAFFFEVKTGSGQQTENQLLFQRWIQAAGGTCVPLRSIEEGITILEGSLQ